MTTNRNRTLPYSLTAEASILGGIMLRNEVLQQLDTLEVEDFYDHRHKVVFQAMRNLELATKPIDLVTLELEITKAGKFEAIGGVGFIGQLALEVPTVDNVLAYAKEVEDYSRIRKLALVAGDLVQRAYEPGLEVDEYFGEAMRRIAELDSAKPDEAKPIGDVVKRRIRELEEIVRKRDAGEQVVTGIPSGIQSFDDKVGGYPLGDLIVLAARPAMGKTAMAMASVDAATKAGHGAIVFSTEGGWRMFADRAIARASGIAVSRLRNAELGTRDDAEGLALATLKYHHRQNWLLDSRADLRATDIIRTARRHKAKHNIRLVVVDYVQILRRPKGLQHDENAALDATITAFSQAAVGDDVCYLVLSQLNRKVEERNDKRPLMSDLRGSGALEERPRMIVSPFRGSAYYAEPKLGIDFDCTCGATNVRGQPCRCAPSPEDFKRQVQILLLKNNNGSAGAVMASWRGDTTEMS